MTNSVFSTMQDIENVATDIIKSYDNEIYTYKAVSQKELEIDEVNKTIKENDAKIQYISSSRRGEFVEKIIGRVVEKYGY